MFKKAILLGVFLTANAHAIWIGPIASKYTDSGFVPRGMRTSTQCSLYADKIVITLGTASVQTTHEKAIKLQGDIFRLVSEAEKGPIKSESAPTDGPASVYFAYQVQPNDAVKIVDLGSYNGGDGRRTTNESEAAQELRNLLDLLCR